jgi:hypothetical protein
MKILRIELGVLKVLPRANTFWIEEVPGRLRRTSADVQHVFA